MSTAILDLANAGHKAIGRFFDTTTRNRVELAHEYRKVVSGAHANGLCYAVARTAAAAAGDGSAVRTIAIQVYDQYGVAVTEAHGGIFVCDVAEEYDSSLSLPVYYKLDDTTSSHIIDQSQGNGAPLGRGGLKKPWIEFVTGSTGATTLRVKRVGADGATAKVTNASEALFTGYVKLHVQPEIAAMAQGIKLADFT